MKNHNALNAETSTLLSSTQLFDFAKKGVYSNTKGSQHIPMAFFDVAQYQIQQSFPLHTIERKTLTCDSIQVSGFHVTNPQGKLAAFVVLNTSASIKEKVLFKVALYVVLNHMMGTVPVKCFALYINNQFTLQSKESLFNVENVSLRLLPVFPMVLNAVKNIKNVTASEDVTDKTTTADILPSPFNKKLKQFLAATPDIEISNVSEDLLNDLQKRVKSAHVSGKTYFDKKGIYNKLVELCDMTKPLYFLDFETAQFVVPEFKSSRPYEQTAFQYSLHRYYSGRLTHVEFLEMNTDPRLALATQLINDLGNEGAILTYNVGFERKVIKTLAEQFPQLSTKLLAIVDRLVDLLPLMKKFYYNPSQKGSWSLKHTLPAIMGYNPYAELDGTSNGSDAASLYHKVRSGVVDSKQAHLDLSAYCMLDTMGLYEIVQFILESQITAKAA
ncbi:MAG: hypothetical protein ACI936_000043 [Paraglaciecola sp.]|jgi:hypothetical protein